MKRVTIKESTYMRLQDNAVAPFSEDDTVRHKDTVTIELSDAVYERLMRHCHAQDATLDDVICMLCDMVEHKVH